MIGDTYQTPALLMFNFADDDRKARILRYLKQNGMDAIEASRADQQKTLACLFRLPGNYPEIAGFRPFFDGEMLVMKGFDRTQLDDLLSFFKTEGLKRNELKAVLTPSNAGWSAAALYAQLALERDSFLRRAAAGKKPGKA